MCGPVARAPPVGNHTTRHFRSYVKTVLFQNNLQGDFGHFRENNLIIFSKVAKIALKFVFKLKRFGEACSLRTSYIQAAAPSCLILYKT